MVICRYYSQMHVLLVVSMRLKNNFDSLILDKMNTCHIVNIIRHDRCRGKEIVTEAVRKIITDASLEIKKVTLVVEKNNPAQKLYSRLGFKIQTSDELFLKMAT